MYTKKYIKWYIRTHKESFFHILRHPGQYLYPILSFIKNIPRRISNKPTNLEVIELGYWLSKKFLKIAYYFQKSVRGHPTDFNSLEDWKEAISKMRYAHFYINFIENEELAYYLQGPEDIKYVVHWAKKKYWWVEDFITEDFLNVLYPGDDLYWNIQMKFPEATEEDAKKGTRRVLIEYKNSKTGEIREKIELHRDVYLKEHLKDYEEGMELLKKYFFHLWD